MKQPPIILLLIALFVSGAFAVTAQAPAEKRPTVLNILKVGQKVNLKDVAGRYEVSLYEEVPAIPGYTIQQIEADHLVVQDVAGINELHIPIYSLKAIIRVTLPQK